MPNPLFRATGLFKSVRWRPERLLFRPLFTIRMATQRRTCTHLPKKSKRLNVLGLLSRDNDLQVYSTTGTICSDLMIAFLDDFATQITQKTVVVLDNAPIHHSEEFENQMAIWQEKDLYIFFLPTYSPHLNLIETLWRKSKYEWLKPHHYQSFEILTQAVENILTNLAKEFKIDFSELKHFIDCKTSFNFS